jgi:hypothetical protein
MQKLVIAFGHRKKKKKKSANWRNSDEKRKSLSVVKKN